MSRGISSSVNAVANIAALSLVLLSLAGQCYGQLRPGFYTGKCISHDFDFFSGEITSTEENVEEIVTQKVAKEFARDPTLAAALLRLQFHDCFVEVLVLSVFLFIFYYFFYSFARELIVFS